MNDLRRWIELCGGAALRESVGDEIHQTLSELDLPRKILPAGTVLYHGTDRPRTSWNPRNQMIWSPGWFGLDIVTARDYAKWQRSGELGRPYIIEYKTTRDLSLADISGQSADDVITHLYDDYTSDDIAQTVLALGFDGWISPPEVMIGDVDSLRFVRTTR